MPWATVLALVVEFLKDAPELIADVEKIVADFKGQGSAAQGGSASAAVHQATDQLEAELLAPPKQS